MTWFHFRGRTLEDGPDGETTMDLEHPRLTEGVVQFRGYQANLARIAGNQDTLVVLPTGMGKTVIALLAIADAFEAGASRILLLAPTKPLVEQHGRFFGTALKDGGQVHVLTGNTPPSKRQAHYEQGLVIATPQVIQNDLIAGRIPGGFDWVVYDECHRAVGEYPYVFIGQHLRRQTAQHRRLGLTASPGHDVQKIDEVRAHLGLEHVEIRTPTDPDVKEFVQNIETEWETLPLPPNMARVVKELQDALNDRVKALRAAGHLEAGNPNRMRLLECGKRLQSFIQRSSDPEPGWFASLSLQAQAMKLQHALEQAQTQGSQAFAQYIDNLRKEAEGPRSSKANRAVVDDHRVNKAYHIARHDESETPKMGRVETLVQEQLEKDQEGRIIVFTHYRSTCETVVERLAKLPGVRPVVFVGQGKRRGKGGLTQKQQAQIVQEFTEGTYNVLVATSVAEEGLDIPETDLVVFYEPIPSEIRSIQRRGRTGRKRDGRVVVLMTKGTQDEAAHWSSRRKEAQMVKELQTLRHTLAGRGQTTLTSHETRPTGTRVQVTGSAPSGQSSLFEGPRIVCDAREQPGQVVKHLSQLGAKVEARTLDIGDFVLSDRIAVERKAGADFVASLVDGRLFDQLAKLKEYPRPVLVLEGALSGHRNIAPEALMGALASVTIDYGIPVMQTEDPLATARYLLAVAKREQGRGGRRVALRATSNARDDTDVRLAVLRALPGVSDMRAEVLLHAFGSIAAVFAASHEELAAVDGIGPKTAGEIRRIIDPETLSKAT